MVICFSSSCFNWFRPLCEQFLQRLILFDVQVLVGLVCPSVWHLVHRRGIRLHTVRRRAQPDLFRQLGCLEADFNGHGGLVFPVVESGDSGYPVAPRLKIPPHQLQFLASHGDGSNDTFNHRSWDSGTDGIPRPVVEGVVGVAGLRHLENTGMSHQDPEAQ